MDSDDLLFVFLIVLVVPVLTFVLVPVFEKIVKRIKR